MPVKVRQGVYWSSLKANMAVDAAALNMLMRNRPRPLRATKARRFGGFGTRVDDLVL